MERVQTRDAEYGEIQNEALFQVNFQIKFQMDLRVKRNKPEKKMQISIYLIYVDQYLSDIQETKAETKCRNSTNERAIKLDTPKITR